MYYMTLQLYNPNISKSGLATISEEQTLNSVSTTFGDGSLKLAEKKKMIDDWLKGSCAIGVEASEEYDNSSECA